MNCKSTIEVLRRSAGDLFLPGRQAATAFPALLDTCRERGGLVLPRRLAGCAGDGSAHGTVDGVNDMLIALADAWRHRERRPGHTRAWAATSSVLSTNFALCRRTSRCYGAYPGKWVMRDGQLVNGFVLDETLDALKGLKYAVRQRRPCAPDFRNLELRPVCGSAWPPSQVGAAFGTYYIRRLAAEREQGRRRPNRGLGGNRHLATLGGNVQGCHEPGEHSATSTW